MKDAHCSKMLIVYNIIFLIIFQFWASRDLAKVTNAKIPSI